MRLRRLKIEDLTFIVEATTRRFTNDHASATSESLLELTKKKALISTKNPFMFGSVRVVGHYKQFTAEVFVEAYSGFKDATQFKKTNTYKMAKSRVFLDLQHNLDVIAKGLEGLVIKHSVSTVHTEIE